MNTEERNGKSRKVELLAPAGNVEGFWGAVNAGADAVYLGGERFGARAYADNFTMDEIVACIRFAHILDRKVYLTVNILLKETELEELCDFLRPAYEAGLDGVIVQDIGALAVMREAFGGMELHASTQMTITGSYGAALLQQMGIDRIVPARELSLEEIRQIKADTGLEIETFIHGAMCYCYSGQCLFSSVLGGRSGNRGRCAQPCRLPYRVTVCGRESGEGYPLSLKDMCTIEYLPALIEAGIDSFKIEGRMKKPEYTAGITAIYRKYIDRIYDGENTYSVEKEDRDNLSKLYTRSEQQAGYYFKQNGAEMVTWKSPAYSGSDEELLQKIRRAYLETRKTLPVAMSAIFRPGERARLALTCRDVTVCVEGEVVGEAIRQPITKENIEKQLRKLGGTVFSPEEIKVTLEPNAFYPLKAINELRRSGVHALEDALIAANGFVVTRHTAGQTAGSMTERQATEQVAGHMAERQSDAAAYRKIVAANDAAAYKKKLLVSVATREQLLEYVSWSSETHPACKALFLDAQMVLECGDEIWEWIRPLRESIYISLPYIMRRKDDADMHVLLEISRAHADRIEGLLVRCLEELGFLLREGYEGAICADAGFYMWNRRTVQEWSAHISGFCLPLELRGAEQSSLLREDGMDVWKLVYGRIPMMITANCVARTVRGCERTGETALLTDRYNKQFPVRLNCRNCLNVIYNSVPHALHGELSKWRDRVDMLLAFTVEEPEEMRGILQYFHGLLRGENLSPPYREYTTGHERRGVE